MPGHLCVDSVAKLDRLGTGHPLGLRHGLGNRPPGLGPDGLVLGVRKPQLGAGDPQGIPRLGPGKLGAKGVEEIIKLNLTADEQAQLRRSSESVRELVDKMASRAI